MEAPDDDLIKDAVAAAQKSDVTLIFAGTSYLYESEGFDRDNIDLPENQNKLIDEVSKVNKNVIVGSHGTACNYAMER